MNPVQKHLFETNFSGIDGTKVEGTLALSDELINLGIGEILSQFLPGGRGNGSPEGKQSAPASAPKTSSQSSGPDIEALKEKISIERFNYRTETGKTFVEIKLSVG